VSQDILLQVFFMNLPPSPENNIRVILPPLSTTPVNLPPVLLVLLIPGGKQWEQYQTAYAFK
jgi:hypothetical protein